MSFDKAGYLIGRNFVYPDYRPQFPKHYGYALKHLRAQIRVKTSERAIEGLAEYSIDVPPGRDYIELDAAEMKIISVKVNGQDTKFEYDGRVLRVYISPGNHTVQVNYETKPRKGLYFILPDEHYRDRVPMVWTQGESEDNHYWIPMPDYPNVKFTSELLIIVPKTWTAVSNGILVETKDLGDEVLWHWRLDKPHSAYLVAFAAGEFEVVREDCDGITIEHYVPRGFGDRARFSFYRTCDMIRFYSEYTGVRYPWPNYKHVAVSEFIYGGMENTTITIVTDTTLHDEHAHCPGSRFPCPGMEDFTSDGLVAHELAHQWFGDYVTTKDWANIWLNEAFATYFEALYTERAKGRDEFLYELYQNLRSYLNEYGNRYARPIVTRMYKDPEEMFDRHTYEKGSLVLHTLRNLLGDEVFQKGINLYLTRHAHGNADTEDLRKALEEVSGQPLDWFFTQFVYSSGHPVIKYSWSYDPGNKFIKLSISQAQGDDSYPIYRLPLEFEIKYPSGKVDLLRIELNEREVTIYVPASERPQYVCIDPQFKVGVKSVSSDKGVEEAIAELGSDNIMCRLEAIDALARDGSARAVEGLSKALMNDPFWGVRAEAARALGRVGTDDALKALLNALNNERHPRVRQAIAEALGNFKGNGDAARVLTSILENTSESYYVRSKAAQSLGKLGMMDYAGELIKALNYPSHNHVITQGALQGLSELGTDEAVDTLIKYTELGKPTLVRMVATQSLGKFVGIRRVYDRIRELLKDPYYRVRYAAVAAVESSLDPRFLDALDDLASRDLDGRIRRYARDVARKIREQMQRGVEYARLREEIERIREEQRRIMDRLGRMEAKG
ncbi:M1 family aminopeptidase [Vulcanisaeta distributa]|uniref:Peptidase M1 membrane alanine aminopeptidase n=1 Tax=Vulcanisaeta distributa (strain DSM 14429 / JCM 11212 / NBRC 100878 / IC-017) TaxID=572478 RepID=E1QTB8_VULDI|nr:M1 family aminopeptidase [Vulcanisaeta distributa]ADN50911.1 Peptidase M1 membrane alanine aminopeptidase [Vulcanisaeta distributa DSM 14429]